MERCVQPALRPVTTLPVFRLFFCNEARDPSGSLHTLAGDMIQKGQTDSDACSSAASVAVP